MDFIRPFGCNCQNNPSADTIDSACNKQETYDEFGNMPLAMAYVPWQTWRNVYDSANGLHNGTIFGELIFPFLCANPVCRANHCDNQRSNQYVNPCVNRNENRCDNRNENRCDNRCNMERRCNQR